MVDASDFIEGKSIDASLLAGTVVGSIAAAYFSMVWRFIDEVGTLVQMLLFSPIEALTALANQVFLIPVNSLEAAYQAAADFLRALEPAGPIVWIAGILLTFGTLVVFNEALARMGLI